MSLSRLLSVLDAGSTFCSCVSTRLTRACDKEWRGKTDLAKRSNEVPAKSKCTSSNHRFFAALVYFPALPASIIFTQASFCVVALIKEIHKPRSNSKKMGSEGIGLQSQSWLRYWVLL